MSAANQQENNPKLPEIKLLKLSKARPDHCSQPRPSACLRGMLTLNPALQVQYLALLDLLHAHGIISRLLNLLHEFLLLIREVVDPGHHLFLVLFGL